MKTKICTNPKCLQPKKPLSEFGNAPKHKDGLKYWCKECTKEYEKEYNYKNKEQKVKYEKEYHKKYPWKQILVNIKQRCENPNNKKYKNYGKRGIKCLIIEEEIKFLWYRDKAYNMKKPSIDRIDNDGNYELSNCEFIEWSENSIKDKRKPILQYDLDNNFIKEFCSISEASRQLKISHSYISSALRCNQKTAKEFIWKYKNE